MLLRPNSRVLELLPLFYVALGVACVVYFYLLANFPTGNHDWDRVAGLDIHSVQFRLGRWFSPAIFSLTWFKQLPVISALIAIAAQVLSGFLFCYLIELSAKREVPRIAYVLSGIFVSVIPFSNWTFYYTWMAASAPVAQALCLISLILVYKYQRGWSVILGSILVMLSMAAYQSSINTIATVYFVLALVQLVFVRSASNLGVDFKRMAYVAAAVCFGALGYKLSLTLFDGMGLLKSNAYQFKYIALSDLPARFFQVAEVSLKHLFVAHPFFPLGLKYFLLVIGFFAVFNVGVYWVGLGVGFREGAFRFLVGLCFIFLMIISTKIQFLVSAQDRFYLDRFASFGVTYFYLFFMVLVLILGMKRFSAAPALASGVCLMGLAMNTVEWQGSYIMQNEYDKRFLNRVIARIEGLEGFEYGKRYNLIQLGGIPNVREDLYSYQGVVSPYHVFTIQPNWSVQDMYNKLEPRFKLSSNLRIEKHLKSSSPRVQERVEVALEYIDRSEEWPHKSSVALVGHTIYIILEKGERFERIYKIWSDNKSKS